MVNNSTLSVTVVTGVDLPHVDALRARATTRDDLAWVCARPPSTRDQYAPLTQDLLSSMGVVGLGTPRANGDRHPVRVMAHLRTSPVRQVVLTEAQWLAEEVISDISQALLISCVRLVLLAAPPITPGWMAWARDHVGSFLPLNELAQRLAPPLVHCALRHDAVHALETWTQVPSPCAVHEQRVACVVSAIRRAVSSGLLVAAQAREPLKRLEVATDATEGEWWGLRAAGLDLFTPGMDAVVRSGHLGESPPISAVAVDGGQVGGASVPRFAQPALSRQRAAVAWSNGWPAWPIKSVFDSVPG